MSRVLDKVFFFYFFIHIPITIFIDIQSMVPSWFFPSPLVELKEWYCREWLDPMMMKPPPFYISFCISEVLFQLPFFFVAAYAYYKGAASCKWIRLPVIVYSSHVITTVFAIIAHAFLTDFSKSEYPGPSTLHERFFLLTVYLPFLVIPMMQLADALFSSVFNERATSKQKLKKR